MIPIRLRIAGFLSYCEPVELDFSSFDLACISGPNGAGKSTLLDAITWALFGQARKRDDSLVNLQSRAAEVTLTFRYEGAVYRVQRTLVRGKTPVLEFQVQQRVSSPAPLPSSTSSHQIPESDIDEEIMWRPLTERTLRETQSRIEQTLRLDYETFVNASFFLQGKADQFAQQSPAKRKDVLSNILGLGMWETYKSRATEMRRQLEAEIGSLEGRRAEIAAELVEEAPRRQRLAQLEADLFRLSAARKAQDSALDAARKSVAALELQRSLVDALSASLQRSLLQVASMERRMSERQLVRGADAGLIQRADEINSAHAAWKKAQAAVEQWNTVASTFREYEQRRAPLVENIAIERARLSEEQRGLLLEQQEIANQAASIGSLESDMARQQGLLAELDARAADRLRMESLHSSARESHASLVAENEVLRNEMETLKTRMSTLSSAVGAACPLCGQPLSTRHRKSTIKILEAEGKQRGDKFRANKLAANKLALAIKHQETELGAFLSLEADRRALSEAVAQLSERLETLRSLARAWKATGLKRLRELQTILDREKYAIETHKELARVDKELAHLGYNAAAHDAARRAEQEERVADEDFRQLQSAVAALAPLDDEIRNLASEIANRKIDIAAQQAEVGHAQASLEAAERLSPDLAESERLLFGLQEQENQLNQELGGARQKVSVLADLRLRDAELEASRQGLAISVSRHRALERAFGKDGVPALLIEQALPEIETRANELLDRLSDGQMSVRFLTQAGYKDRRRDDLKETLEIQISDGAGVRDYELYSGGEAFRIDFAVRLALSEVLAGRKAARLQTLVIDEGFASQDIQGRQRLIEAINRVKDDFAMILVITHLDELKDAFPTRIEVEKTSTGSKAWVI